MHQEDLGVRPKKSFVSIKEGVKGHGLLAQTDNVNEADVIKDTVMMLSSEGKTATMKAPMAELSEGELLKGDEKTSI